MIGRTLRQAGFDVAFAAEARELVSLSRVGRPALVVATPSFPPMGGDAAVRSVRTATLNPDLPALVIAGRAAPAHEAARSMAGTGQLLLLAESVKTRVDPGEQRRSRRTLYSTLCAFRAGGSLEPTYGMTHDLGRDGLYVRTLDAPEPGTALWIELRTVDGTPVHLRGTVTWRKQPSEGGGGTLPGFGLKIDVAECPPVDLASYVLSYDQLQQMSDRIN
jgi:hypothetical protein